MSANTNHAIQPGKGDTFNDVASIANKRDTTVSDVLIALAKKQLESVKNKGKTKFLAVVTKVLEGHTSDPFLNEEYEADRVDGTTKQLQKNSKVVLLHIPALYTYYENQSVEIKNSTDLKQEIGTIDLYKISCVTTKNVQPNDIVNVEFEDTSNFKNPKITTLDKKDKLRLNADVVKFLKAKEILKEQNACKLLNTEEAQGYAIKSKVFLNPGNPKFGYTQFYNNFSDIAKKDNILKQIVRNKSSAELSQIGLSASATSTEAYSELTTNSQYKFSISLSGNPQVVNYINSNTSIKPSEKIISITTNSDAKRELFLKIETPNINGNTFKNYIVDYLKSIITSEFNYSWADSGDKSYKVDIFGSSKIDDGLKNGGVSLAIEYSTKVDNVSRNNATSLTEKTVKTPLKTSKTPQQTASDATKQNVTGSKPAAETPVCDNTATVNNELYINVKESKKTSFNSDNKKFKSNNVSLKDWFSEGLEQAIFKDRDETPASSLPDNNNFSYTKEVEVISGSPESVKQNATTRTRKKEKVKPVQRGTNDTKVGNNLKELVRFCKELTKLIAVNENVPLNKVYVLPISVFRKYQKSKIFDDGQDDNSRHFFGRAIDFTVYVNYDEQADLKSKSIPTEGTYEIPNTIIYLYVLALLKLHKTKFGVCGIGLLRDGTKRKSGYVHYEYMRETSNENVGLLKNRRWVSQPKKKEKDTVYAKAFGQPDSDKDRIIKDFAFKDIKAKIGIIPEKLENLL
jgi:hypothetical protein